VNAIVIAPNFSGEFGFEIEFNFTAEQLAEAGINGENVRLFHVDYDGNVTDKGQATVNDDGSITFVLDRASFYVLSEEKPEVLQRGGDCEGCDGCEDCRTTSTTEPTTNTTEPTSDDEPTTEPTTESTEPTTESTEPTTESTEPNTDSSEPTTTPTDPIPCECSDCEECGFASECSAGHTWVVVDTIPATCLNPGSETQECECGATRTVTLRRLGGVCRATGAWVVTTPATATAEGVESRSCANCPHVFTRSIPMLSGSQDCDECRNCDDCGYLGGTFGFGRVTDNENGIVIQDALAILRYLVNLSSPIDNCADARAAANIMTPGSGEIVIQDALQILRYLVGLPNRIDD
jgi:hypothetical protein